MIELHPDFEAHPLLRSAHGMTIVGSQWGRGLKDFAAQAEAFEVRVSEHTRILVEANWQPQGDAPVLVLVHGLGGDARRSYMLGTAEKAFRRGFHVVRMNMRNSAGTGAWTPTLYNAGLTEDLLATTGWVTERLPSQPIVLGGFSLGGSVILNTLAEWGSAYPQDLRGAVVVSVPFDLHIADVALRRGGMNRLYVKYFMRGFRRLWLEKHAAFPELYPQDGLHGVRTVRDFDEKWTGPSFGYASADDYYASASAIAKLNAIHAPVLAVHAADDPFVPLPEQARAQIENHASCQLLWSRHGGHVGFLARRAASNSVWQDADRWWAENRVVQAAHEWVRMA